MRPLILRRRPILLLPWCFAAFFALALALLAAQIPSAAAQNGPELGYSVEFEGQYTQQLLKTLKAALPLYTQVKDTPTSQAQLRGRLAQSLDVAVNVLKSEGYYAATITGRIAPRTDRNAKRVIRLRLSARQRYQFSAGAISLNADAKALSAALRVTAAEVTRPGAPARAQIGNRLAPALLVRLRELGHPFATVKTQRFIVDHQAHSVMPNIALDVGPKARIAEINITGLKTVEPRYVRLLAGIEGKPIYDQRDIDAFRDRLIQTGLFSGIQILPVPPETDVSADGKPASTQATTQDITLRVALTEGAHRQISAQVGFSTDQGFSVESAWTHRNFLGYGEIFTVRGRLAELEQSLDVILTLPNFRQIDQSLNLNLGVSREDNDAFTLLSASTAAILERRLSPRWVVSGGGRIEAQRVDDDLGRRTFYLGGIPISARYDGAQNLFDPQNGIRLDTVVTPEIGFGDASLTFVTNDVILRGYKSFNWGKGTVLAARVRVGAVLGEDTVTLPANRRFYAGGGGSIRGYGFQNVGPIDGDGDPSGGRSLLEVAAEARIKVTPTIGVVPFIDFGNVYDTAFPELSGLQYGAGLGLRYHTDFAPIRFDIGTPLNPRDGDDPVQIYISIGQNF